MRSRVLFLILASCFYTSLIAEAVYRGCCLLHNLGDLGEAATCIRWCIPQAHCSAHTPIFIYCIMRNKVTNKARPPSLRLLVCARRAAALCRRRRCAAAAAATAARGRGVTVKTTWKASVDKWIDVYLKHRWDHHTTSLCR